MPVLVPPERHPHHPSTISAMTRTDRWLPRLLMAMVVALAACDAGDPGVDPAPPADSAGPGPAPSAPAAPPAATLVDPDQGQAVAGEDGWMYSQSVQADLDADGAAERVVLTARVELYRGRPAWDDGQQWQVYVEEADGTRTPLYARFVQLGTVTMRVGRAEGSQGESVVLLEHLPDRMAVYEVEYRGPGDVTALERFQRALDPTGDVASPDLP